MSEQHLVDAVLRWLRLQGCYCWRQNVGALQVHTPGRRSRFVRFGGIVGASDVMGVARGGRAVFIECKRKPNRLTEHQQQFIEDVRARGAFALCVWDIQELIDAWEQTRMGVDP